MLVEMHAGKAIGPTGGAHQLRRKDERGIGSEEGVLGTQTAELLPDLSLEFHSFGQRFAHEIGLTGSFRQVRRRRDSFLGLARLPL